MTVSMHDVNEEILVFCGCKDKVIAQESMTGRCIPD
jgi:hypothetical protein